MTQQLPFSDEQLTAYLDRALEADDVVAIESALETDDDLFQRLHALDIDKRAIQSAFDDLLMQAPAMPDLPDTVTTPQQKPAANTNAKPGLVGGLALFGTGIAAGVAMMLLLPSAPPPAPAPPGWKAVVATYQSLYAPQTFASDTASPEDHAAQLAAASTAIGVDLTQIPNVQGLEFKRGQVLGFNGKPLIQLAFARSDGTPVALCIIAAKTAETKQLATETIQGMAAASWNRDGLAYLLIGGDQAALTQSEARAFEIWAGSVTAI